MTMTDASGIAPTSTGSGLSEARTLPDGTEIGPCADAEAVERALQRLLMFQLYSSPDHQPVNTLVTDARAALDRMQAAQQAVDGLRRQRDHECERSNLFAGFIRSTPGLLDKYDAYSRMAALEHRP